jgi:hypothetical protein
MAAILVKEHTSRYVCALTWLYKLMLNKMHGMITSKYITMFKTSHH